MPDREKSNRVMPDSDPDLDLLIRNAAATYGNPASNSDLAERILSRVSAENTATTTRWWMPWAAALPVAACLVFVFMFFAPRRTHTPPNRSEQAHSSAQPSDKVGSTTATRPIETAQTASAKASKPRTGLQNFAVATVAQSLPKLDKFPTPQALTPEEQALATYAAVAPKDEQQALIEAHDKLEAPLTIAAITIQPLEPPTPGGN